MDTWYDTLLISEYGITVLILGYGAFSWLLYYMVVIHALLLALCCV